MLPQSTPLSANARYCFGAPVTVAKAAALALRVAIRPRPERADLLRSSLVERGQRPILTAERRREIARKAARARWARAKKC